MTIQGVNREVMKINKFSCAIILLSFFICLTSFSYSQSLLIHREKTAYSYKDNPNYLKRMELFATQKDQKNIVMLGDSHTERGQWKVLLGRTDVANRGIGSDIFEGYIHRINDVFDLNPIVCFIEGGGNDLGHGVSQRAIISNLTILIDTLEGKGIIPVLKTMDYVADNYRSDNPKEFNKRVKLLNQVIKTLAKEKNITLINLNSKVNGRSYLLKQYAVEDGVHYTQDVYSMWKEEILKILSKLILDK